MELTKTVKDKTFDDYFTEVDHSESISEDRPGSMRLFYLNVRSGKIKILVTSDLVARGMDIPNISHVIQMDMPSDDDFFIHRAGRTARMGKTGINIVIGDGFEMRKYAAIEKKLKITVYPRMLYKGKLIDPNELNNENSSQS